MNNVLSMSQHPKRIQERVRSLAANLDKVVFSPNINDLSLARKISMRDVWACLEEGVIDDRYLSFDLNGTYLKLVCHTGGETVFVDACIPAGKDCIEVLFATIEEF